MGVLQVKRPKQQYQSTEGSEGKKRYKSKTQKKLTT